VERYTEDVDPQRVVGTTLPHSSFGDPDCCGCLNGFVRGDQADIVCNECNVVIYTIPAADLQEAFTKMETDARSLQRRLPTLRSGEPIPRIFGDHGVYM
jgi:hypothetical protein